MDLEMKNEATEQSYSCNANWKRAELEKYPADTLLMSTVWISVWTVIYIYYGL